jgi:5-methylcytosine-specific restriction endonuclease McrA
VTPETIQDVRSWRRDGVTWKECARRLNVAVETLRRAVNPEVRAQHLAGNVRWRAANVTAERAKDAAWQRANPVTCRHKRHRHRARQRSASGTPWTAAEQQLLLEQIYQACCIYCGVEGVPLTLDHVVPLSRGGAHDRSNLVFCCLHCNSSKGAKLLSEWRGGAHVGVVTLATEVAELIGTWGRGLG